MVNSIEWNDKIQVIDRLITALYDTDFGTSGGLCHIVTDDGNIYDDDLDFVMEYCNRIENQNSPIKELCYLIALLLKQLSFEQRACLMAIRDFGVDIDENTWFRLQNTPDLESLVKTYYWRDEDD